MAPGAYVAMAASRRPSLLTRRARNMTAYISPALSCKPEETQGLLRRSRRAFNSTRLRQSLRSTFASSRWGDDPLELTNCAGKTATFEVTDPAFTSLLVGKRSDRPRRGD